MEGPIKRRLAAILAADAVGYSSRMGEDEERTLRTLTGHRKVIDGLIAAHDGRIVATAGDGMLAEFGSSVEAVRCAVEIQEALATRNDSLPEPERLSFRIGVNLGDVIVDGADILGDGVNVAARLEGIAEPGGICVASSVFDQISGKLNLGFVDLGEQSLKNIARPVRAYRFAHASEVPSTKLPARASRPRSLGRTAGAVATVAAALLGAYALGMRGSKAPEPAPVAAQPATTPPSEDTRLRLQIAEAERAKSEAELARVRAEALRQPATAAPVEAASTKAAPLVAKVEPAPTPASQPAPQPAPQFDVVPPSEQRVFTRGIAQANCEPEGDEPGFTARAPVRVVSGEVVIATGPRGGPSQINLRGRPSADGTLVLQGRIVGSGRNRGREVLVRYEGRLIDGKGTLTGRQGLRSCSIALELM